MSGPLEIMLDLGEEAAPGHALRAALSLACATGRAFSVVRFRALRPEPGLRPQHVQAIRLAARLCGAEPSGAEAGSQRLRFEPGGPARAVEGLAWDAGPTCSTGRLLELTVPALALAGAASTLTLRGATHQPGLPSFHQLALAWAPAMQRLGFKVELSLGVAGFHGQGGGLVTARVEPARAMPPLDLGHRGMLCEVEVLSLAGGLDPDAGALQAARAVRALRALGVPAEAERLPVPVQGSAGSHLLVVARFERFTSGHGATAPPLRPPAEAADLAVAAFRAHLDAGGAVDGLLGAQLVVPAALLAAGRVAGPAGLVPATRFTVSEITAPLLALAEVVPRFLPVEVAVVGRRGALGEVRVQPAGGALGVLPMEGGRG